jgi:hypothetical protein
VRYEGQFVNGKLEGLKPADCPSTPGRSFAVRSLTVDERGYICAAQAREGFLLGEDEDPS